jgi:hypothetical protein
MTSLDAYYEQLAQLQETYNGLRVQLVNRDDIRQDFTTGTLEASEDGLTMILDTPLPEWCSDYEDAKTGRLYFDDDKSFEVI